MSSNAGSRRRGRAAAGEDNSAGRRGRGRGRGRGRDSTAAAAAAAAQSTTARTFTPHAIRIGPGENIVERISVYSQTIGESFFVMSAFGTVSRAELFLLSDVNRRIRVYEGNLEIIKLNGSLSWSRQNLVLTVHLRSQDGHYYGGTAASLIAGGPTEVVIGSFRENATPPPLPHPGEPSALEPGGAEPPAAASAPEPPVAGLEPPSTSAP